MLGPSGCGKTTTLRLIPGFERPTEGKILLDGNDMSRTPPHKRRAKTGFQRQALFPHKSVAENVAFGLRYQRATKAEVKRRVSEAMALVRLEDYGHRRPTQLSGGQQHRAAPRAPTSGGSPWRPRSGSGRPCCSSTSRSAPSTRACASTSRSSSSAS